MVVDCYLRRSRSSPGMHIMRHALSNQIPWLYSLFHPSLKLCKPKSSCATELYLKLIGFYIRQEGSYRSRPDLTDPGQK